MKKETKTAPQTAVPEKPAAPERVHGLDLISKYRGAIMGFAALWILFFHEWVTLFVNNQVGVNIEGYLKRIGFCGVDIFLLLSGIGLTFAIPRAMSSPSIIAASSAFCCRFWSWRSSDAPWRNGPSSNSGKTSPASTFTPKASTAFSGSFRRF